MHPWRFIYLFDAFGTTYVACIKLLEIDFGEKRKKYSEVDAQIKVRLLDASLDDNRLILLFSRVHSLPRPNQLNQEQAKHQRLSKHHDRFIRSQCLLNLVSYSQLLNHPLQCVLLFPRIVQLSA